MPEEKILEGKKRGEKTRCSETWTEARYFYFIRSALRNAWRKYPVRYEALRKASRPYVGPDKRCKTEKQCAKCKKWFIGNGKVEVDHIIPAGSLTKFADLPLFCARLFCEVDNLQVLCKPCHKNKGD